MTGYLFLTIIAFSLAAFLTGRAAARRFAAEGRSGRPAAHSVPAYHGAFVAIWVGIPALILALLWRAAEGPVIDRLLARALPPEMTAGLSPAALDLLLTEIHHVAEGRILAPASPGVIEAAARLAAWSRIGDVAMFVVVLALMLLGAWFACARLTPRFRARTRVEGALSGLMILCSGLALATTLGIIVSLVHEAVAFFRLVPPGEFLFGLVWEPQIATRPGQIAAEGAFGAVPVFLGTLLISAIAMAFAVPVGLLSAVYLHEYASPRFRRVAKPMLEILAGVPTVVYGFFAILVVAPAIRTTGTMMGLATSPNSALAAGLVIGGMIIPFISSLADDALRAVPRDLRDGSLAMGATPAETMTRVLLPAALPGIAGGILLALSRAIGETMIVVMAAGLIATMTLNPLDSVTTVTVQIVTTLVGDTAFDNPKTLAAFALGLVLFLVTLALNTIGVAIVRRYRETYE
ncbi:phosphate ABC transporter permease subunit PstC [Amaricoccus solimangrovi]|uniref:Phosphate transport system permease protein n=1 Tax=Amaricoccus solimangrovi TaxID=2589815 RepID=A0A501WYZ2_9RHOB|nr:phosphate ABC transporter permease subunit PstC [Amaricoccus solimangrovi]TPE53554.1 phosphate ABC transporter permease subunit PstC [Amaricoccus solimangrovi]